MPVINFLLCVFMAISCMLLDKHTIIIIITDGLD